MSKGKFFAALGTLAGYVFPFNSEKYSGLTTDFGRLTEVTPSFVSTPSSSDEIVSTVRYAADNRLNLSVYGHAHCTGSQSLSNGITVDLKSKFSDSSEPFKSEETGDMVIDIEPGASWRQVFDRLLPLGLTPPTYSDYIELTAGGTISSGGVGQSSHKKGMQADNVIELDIVTGTGELLTCSAKENSDLFYLAKGGYGHFGIMTRIRMRLEKAPKHVSLYKCVYLNEDDFIRDQAQLIQAGFVDTIQAHVTPNTAKDVSMRVGQNISDEAELSLAESDSPWAYVLEVSQYHYDDSEEPDMIALNSHLVKTCSLPATMMFSRTTSFASHVTRVPPILQGGFEIAKPKHHHCCVFMPQSTAAEFLKQTLSKSNRENMGEGTILVIPLFKEKVNPLNLRLPDEKISYMICFLRRHLADKCELTEIEALNDETYHLAIKMGGTPYPVGSGEFLLTKDCWEAYYGDDYPAAIQTKVKHDPQSLLTPGMPIAHAEKKTFKPGG